MRPSRLRGLHGFAKAWRGEQLRSERGGTTPPRSEALTHKPRRIQELEAQVRRLEREKEISKKATALLMSDALNQKR